MTPNYFMSPAIRRFFLSTITLFESFWDSKDLFPKRSLAAGGRTPAQSLNRISAPTARSTADLMAAMPEPSEPARPGMEMTAGRGESL